MQPVKKTLIEKVLPSGETVRVPTPHIRVDRIRSPSPVPLNKFPDADLIPATFSDDPSVQIFVPRPPPSVTESEPANPNYKRVHRSIIIKGSSSLPQLSTGNDMLPPPPPPNKKYTRENYDFKANILSEDSTDDETDAVRLSRKPPSPSTIHPETLQHQVYQEPSNQWNPENYAHISKKGKIPMNQIPSRQKQFEAKQMQITPFRQISNSSEHKLHFNLPDRYHNIPFKPTPVPPKSNHNLWPNRYLKPSDYPFAKNEYPAPLPTAPLPDFLSDDRFLEIKQMVKRKAQTFSMLKNEFNRFMRFKIYDNVYHNELIKTMDLPEIPHGIVKDNLTNPDFDSIKDLIQCAFCEQFALEPRECRSCKKCYCMKCVQWLRQLVEILELMPLTHSNQFLCILPKCIKYHSQKDDYPFFQPLSNYQTLEIYLKTLFHCRRTHCTANLPHDEFLEHEKTCRLGIFAAKLYFNFTFEEIQVSPTVREELKKAPKSLTNFLPEHLQQGNFDLPENHRAHANQWYEKMHLWACLSHMKEEDPNDPHLRPVAIRSVANFKLNFWDAKKQLHDPTHPLSESENFIQNIVGFEPIMGKKIDRTEIPPRPHTSQWSRVPFYLLTDSEEWVKVARGGIPRSNPPFAKTVAPETDDRLTPFIKINPLERLTPERLNELFTLARDYFPSMRGFRIEHIFPSTNNAKALVNRRNKQELATREFHNLTVINMPKLRANTDNLIQQNIESHPSPETTFSMHMAYCRIDGWTVDGKRDAPRPRPIWVVIVDGFKNIVFETLIRHDNITYMDTQFHGLRERDLKHAKSFISVRDQILAFCLTATAIVGAGIINMMRALDLHDDEIYALQHKFRDVTHHFSPYASSPASLSLISFLLFPGFTLRAEPHSPAIEAITSMNLYMAYWQEIEESARKWRGINHENMVRTCGNKKVSKLLQIYKERVANNQARWPSNWAYFTHHNDLQFRAKCVSPASSPTPSEYSNYGSDCNVSVHSHHSSASSTSSIDSINYEYSAPAPGPRNRTPPQDIPLIDLAENDSDTSSVLIAPPQTPINTPPSSQSSTLPQSSQSTIAQAISSLSSSSSDRKRRHHSGQESPQDFPPPRIEMERSSPTSSIYSYLADLLKTPSHSPQSSPAQLSSASSTTSLSSGTSDSASDSISTSSSSSSSSPRSQIYAQGKIIPYPIPPSPLRRIERPLPHSDASRLSNISSSSRHSFTSTASSGSSTQSQRQIYPSQVRSHIFYPTHQRSSSRDSASSNRNA